MIQKKKTTTQSSKHHTTKTKREEGREGEEHGQGRGIEKQTQ